MSPFFSFFFFLVAQTNDRSENLITKENTTRTLDRVVVRQSARFARHRHLCVMYCVAPIEALVQDATSSFSLLTTLGHHVNQTSIKTAAKLTTLILSVPPATPSPRKYRLLLLSVYTVGARLRIQIPIADNHVAPLTNNSKTPELKLQTFQNDITYLWSPYVLKGKNGRFSE